MTMAVVGVVVRAIAHYLVHQPVGVSTILVVKIVDLDALLSVQCTVLWIIMIHPIASCNVEVKSMKSMNFISNTKSQYRHYFFSFALILSVLLLFQKIQKKNTDEMFDNQLKELTDISLQEKSMLKEILIDNLNNNYKLVKKIRTGQSSIAYLITDKKNEKFVLKTPTSSKSDPEKWLNEHLSLYSQISDILDGYSGDVKVPVCVKNGNYFVVEEYLGEELSEEVLQKLETVDRNKICKKIANFLNFLHNNNTLNENKILPVTLPDFFTLKNCYEYVEPILSTAQRKKLLDLIDKFSKRTVSDEVTTRVHYDLRLPNILYNKENKTLAIIDFECIREDNIYYDFCPRVTPRLPIDISSEIIKYYNQKAPNKINIDKVKLFYNIFSIYEICTCSKFRDRIDLTNTTNEKCNEVYACISNIINNL